MRVFYDVKHVVITCIFYDMNEHEVLCYSECCDNNDVMLSRWHARVGMWIIFYDVMIITNALDACWDVVIEKNSTIGPRGFGLFDDLVGAHTCNGEYVTPYGLGTDSINTTHASGSLFFVTLNG